jgi:Flp pilus assembly protein TadG
VSSLNQLDRKTAQRRRRGGTVLEMAIAGTLMVIITYGIIEAGWYFFCKNMMNGAAREAARNGILQSVGTTSGNAASINQTIITYFGNAGLIPHGTTATASGLNWKIGNFTVSFYDYNYDTGVQTQKSDPGGNVPVGDGMDVKISASWAVIGKNFRPMELVMPSQNGGDIVSECVMRKEAE